MEIPVTTLFVAIMALFILYLAYRVASSRRTHKVGVGDGGNREMKVAVRCHANAVEYCPIILLLLLVAELNKVPATWLYIAGGVLVVSRLMHAWGMTKTQGNYSPGRFYGILGTWLVLIFLAGLNLSIYFGIQY